MRRRLRRGATRWRTIDLSRQDGVVRLVRWWPLAALALVLALAAGAMRLAEGQLGDAAAARAAGERRALGVALDRLRHLPVAIAGHPDVAELLATPRLPDAVSGEPGGPSARTALARRVDVHLERVAEAAGARLLYAIDRDGITRASSNHRSPSSLVGNDYAFRPYFREAMAGGESRYFAIGVTTGEAGHYFSRPVVRDGRTLGVVAVKIELESLQRQWEGGDGTRLLVDQHGVSILASRAAWRFRALEPIAEATRAAFAEQRKYGPHALAPLDGRREIDAGGQVRRLALDGTDWLVTELPLLDKGWRLLHLVDLAPVRRAGALAAVAALLVGGLGSVGFLYLRERRRKRRLALADREATRMRRLNRRLEAEVAERERAEQELRAAQGELIQASKLAALGQMSAAIAHEVNQPLSAIRTFSASARLLIDRERARDARANLDEIDALTDRLAALTGDLKVFARKPEGAGDGAGAVSGEARGRAGADGTASSDRGATVDAPVDLGRCIDVAAHHLETPLAEARTRLDIERPAEPVLVGGNALRVERVLSNLIVNAIDATRESASPRAVRVTLDTDAATREAVVRVRDSGPGLDAEALEHLFDPFFTTKPVGQGVGLGLAIAYGIVQEMGGRLRVRNAEDGGALFSLRLALHAAREGDGAPAAAAGRVRTDRTRRVGRGTLDVTATTVASSVTVPPP